MSLLWKQDILKLKELKKGKGRKAWEMAKIVRRVWNNKSFLVDAKTEDIARSRLDEFPDSCGLYLDEMLSMIDRYPKAAEWTPGRIARLRDRVAREIEKEKYLASQKRRAKEEKSNGSRLKVAGKPAKKNGVPVGPHVRSKPGRRPKETVFLEAAEKMLEVLPSLPSDNTDARQVAQQVAAELQAWLAARYATPLSA